MSSLWASSFPPTFIKIWKEKSVQSFKPDPYIATVLNCAMWVFYGMPFVHPDSLLVATINGVGFFIEIAYLTIFFTFSDWPKRKRVIKTKSVKFMPFYLSLANLLNGAVWSVYASVKLDLNVLIPNGLGTLSGLVQVVLYVTYYRSTKRDDDVSTQPAVELQRPTA
ncbi:hypothetical protein ABFX02_09G024000 [Erythranthe guttata]